MRSVRLARGILGVLEPVALVSEIRSYKARKVVVSDRSARVKTGPWVGRILMQIDIVFGCNDGGKACVNAE